MNHLKKMFLNSDKKVLYSFLTSYILLFSIPILVIFILYQFVTTELLNDAKNQMKQTMATSAEQLKLVMDEKVKRSQVMAYNAWQIDEMSYFLRNDKLINVNDTFNIFKISRQLNSFLTSNTFADDITVRLNSKNICIGVDGTNTDEEVYKKYFAKSDGALSFEKWKLLMRQFTAGKLIRAGNSDVTYFLQSMPVATRGESNLGMILIKFSNKSVSKILDAQQMVDDTRLYVVDDKTGNVIASNSSSRNQSLPDFTYSGESGYLAENGIIISYIQSEHIPITYICAVSENVLKHQIDRIRRICIIVMLICIIVGCVLIYYFTIRNYNPIKQLLLMVKGENSLVTNMLDPYSEIKILLLEAADEKTANANRNNQLAEKCRRQKFISALTDRHSSMEVILDYAKECGLKVMDESYCLIKMKYTDCGSFFEKHISEDELNWQPEIVCENIFTQIIGEKFEQKCFSYNGDLLFIVRLEDKNMQLFNGFIKEMLTKAQHYIRENYEMDSYVVLSDIHQGFDSIKIALSEVDKTLEYLVLVGNKDFERHSNLTSIKYRNKFNHVMIKEEALMLGYVKAGDFARAKELFNNIVEKYFYDNVGTPQVLKFRLYALISNILSAINYIDVPNVGLLIDKVNERNKLLNCTNVVEFQSQLNLFFDELEDFCKNADSQNENIFKNKVIEIVNSEYANPDLNVSMIAVMLNRNLDYVSRTFKKVANIGLLDYIHDTRISAAKELMQKRQNLTVQQISSIVGYISCESFIRVFKRKEGVTPGRYNATLEQK